MGSIELTKDFEVIKQVLNDPEVSGRINEGDFSVEFTDKECRKMAREGWILGWFVEGDMKGFYWVHPVTTSIVQIHAHFVKNNRMFAKGSGRAMLEWLDANIHECYVKFIAMIPDCYPDVIGFSNREGLTNETLLSNAYNKDGEMIDLHILSVQRGDLWQQQQ